MHILHVRLDLERYSCTEILFSFSSAGYYSYLYAKCFAATIWKNIFEEDPLSEAAGSALRSKFLEHGGAKDPAIILKDLVGNSVIRNLDGGIIPDITSLGEEMKLVN